MNISQYFTYIQLLQVVIRRSNTVLGIKYMHFTFYDQMQQMCLLVWQIPKTQYGITKHKCQKRIPVDTRSHIDVETASCVYQDLRPCQRSFMELFAKIVNGFCKNPHHRSLMASLSMNVLFLNTKASNERILSNHNSNGTSGVICCF